MKEMEEQIKNLGVKIPVLGTDWIVGSTSQIPYEIVCSDWTPYLSEYDNQFGTVDWLRCVSESYVHTVEPYLNYKLANGFFSQKQITELTNLGYIVKGKFKISIRAVAKMSGTDHTGNSQNAVAEAIRKNGLLPDSDWASSPTMGWNEHYAPIPQNLLDKAKKFLDYVNLQYAWIVQDTSPVADYKSINQTIQKELLQSPLQFTSDLCPSYTNRANGLPCASCNSINTIHAMCIYGLQNDNGALNRKVRDSYPPYNILFANNYPIPYILKIVPTILPELTSPPSLPNIPVSQVTEIQKQDFITRALAWIKTITDYLTKRSS